MVYRKIKIIGKYFVGAKVNEFREVLREVKYGKSLTEALEDNKDNIPSDTINNITLSLTQANLYGSSIIKSLYNQIDYLRDKKILTIKASINKMPVKVSVISVLAGTNFEPVLVHDAVVSIIGK
mgnify:CR=1 FL=1